MPRKEMRGRYRSVRIVQYNVIGYKELNGQKRTERNGTAKKTGKTGRKTERNGMERTIKRNRTETERFF